MSMGKASRKKKVSIKEALVNQGRHKKESKPSQESPSKGSLQKTTLIISFIPVLIILLVSFAVYFNALFGDFVYDDKGQVLDNEWIRDVKNIPTIFSRSVWSFHPGLSISNYYRPLMHIVYMLNYHLFGLKPWGFHLINILFHCGASVLVFLVIRRLLTEYRVTTSSIYLSPPFIAALLFASYPIHTEAVTWIAGLPDVAFTFFYLLSFYLYMDSQGGSSRGYMFSVACFALAAFFKEPALTLPIILFAYDFVFRESRTHPLNYVKKYTPYVVIGVVYMALRVHALGGFAPQKGYAILTSYQYAINVFPLFIQYLKKLLFPLDLNAFYVFHPIVSILGPKGALSFIGTIIFWILFAMALRKNRIASLGLLFVAVPLLPVLYIPALGENAFAERDLYLPSVGFVLLLAISLTWTRKKLPRASMVITFIFMAIVGLYTVGTVNRNRVWKDSFALWSDIVKKSPENAKAHMDLGNEYASKGLLDMAMEQYRSALRLKPDSADAYYNLGGAYLSKGQFDKAAEHYQGALRLRPDFAEAHNNLGAAYLSKGQLDLAMEEYLTAIKLRPDFPEAHNNLALIYLKKGNADMAQKEVEVALSIRPDLRDARQLLNNILSRRH